METISITVYTIDELREQYPEAYRRAHDRYVEDSPWFIEFINEALSSVEHEEDSPFIGRFIEWDVYRNYANYSEGDLRPEEREAMEVRFPALSGAVMRIDESGRLAAYLGYTEDEEAAEEELPKAEAWLADLHGKFADAMRCEWDYLMSDEYFIEDCKSNEWTFESDGNMRNV